MLFPEDCEKYFAVIQGDGVEEWDIVVFPSQFLCLC